MTASERWMAARWALVAIVVGGLFMAVVVAGLRVLEGAYVADERSRVELVGQEWAEHTTTTMPGVHYSQPVVVHSGRVKGSGR